MPRAGVTAAELIRKDLEPILSALYGTFSIGAEYLRASYEEFGSDGYRGYIEDLYGSRRPDWTFLILNYTLLGCLIALPLAIAWLVFG